MSDLTLDDLAGMLQHDGDAVHFLGSYATQLALNIKMGPYCIIKAVLKRVLDQRNTDMGFRARHFKALGGVDASGALNLKIMSYRPMFNSNGFLESIDHVSGNTAVVKDSNISKKFQLFDNYSDFGCYFKLEPMPPVKLALWFQPKKGEEKAGLGHPQLTSASKAWYQLVDQHHRAWQEARKQAIGKGVSQAAKEMVQTQQKDKKRAQASAAREKALTAIAAKKQNRSVSLRNRIGVCL